MAFPCQPPTPFKKDNMQGAKHEGHVTLSNLGADDNLLAKIAKRPLTFSYVALPSLDKPQRYRSNAPSSLANVVLEQGVSKLSKQMARLQSFRL